MRAAISLCAAGGICAFVLAFPQRSFSRGMQSATTTQQGQSNTTRSASATHSDQSNHPAPNLKKLAQQHKVITTDDLEGLHSKERKYPLAKYSGKASSDPALCDADCAAEAREEAEMGPEREGDWQAQFSAAKHYLSGDVNWRYAYMNGLQKAQMYCTFQGQLRKAPPPSGNDYQSRVERAKREQYEEDMDHTLSVGLQGVSTQMNNMIAEAQKTDPVRAAIMSVLARRIFNQCGDLAYDP